VEIERKDEYDTMASMLVDMEYGKCLPLKAHHMGMGHCEPINTYDMAMDKPWSSRFNNDNLTYNFRWGGYKPWMEAGPYMMSY